MADTKVAVIAGVGPGIGMALGERFARGGYSVALLARDGDRMADAARTIEGARGYACDVGDQASVDAAFARVADDLGPVDALLFNAGSGVFKGIEEITPDDFERSWRVNA